MSVCVPRCFSAQDLRFVVRLGWGGGGGGILVWFIDLAFVRGGVRGLAVLVLGSVPDLSRCS